MIRIPLWMPLPGKEVRYPGVGPAYVALVPQLALIAKQNGYAFAVHGSMGRDLDLIAIPWTDKAVEAEELIEAIREKFGLFLSKRDVDQPEAKPHGRLAWSLYFDEKHAEYGHGPYLDISVMPRLSYEKAKRIPAWKKAWDWSFEKHNNPKKKEA